MQTEEGVLAERTALIGSIDEAAWQVHGSIDRTAFLATVASTTPKLLGELRLVDPSQLDDIGALAFDLMLQAGFGEKVRTAKAVVAYRGFVTRHQPANTVKVHGALRQKRVPKETILLSTQTEDGSDLVVYKKLKGKNYMELLEDGNADLRRAFYALGRAQQAYALGKIETVDNATDDWMYDGQRAVRVDLGAAEVSHKVVGNRVVFIRKEDPLRPYTFFMSSLAYHLVETQPITAISKYRRAMEAFTEGFFSRGKLKKARDTFEFEFERRIGIMPTMVLERAHRL